MSSDYAASVSTRLQIGGMAGMDAEDDDVFKDRIDDHYIKTFDSAILPAVIGTAMDMEIPQNSTLAIPRTASALRDTTSPRPLGTSPNRRSATTWTCSRPSRSGQAFS